MNGNRISPGDPVFLRLAFCCPLNVRLDKAICRIVSSRELLSFVSETEERRRFRMRKALVLAILAAIVLLVSACVPGPNELADLPDGDGEVAGFWQGLWHGIIAPVTFVISLFSESVEMYEVHNSGGWYNFGYLFGLVIILGGGGGGAASKRSRD
jgi:hypothetical protein